MQAVDSSEAATVEASKPAPLNGLAKEHVEALRAAKARGVISIEPGGPAAVEWQWLAVLLVDVVGYTRLVERDTLGTALRIRHLRRHLIRPAVRAYDGRVIDQTGDGALIAFPLAESAADCAITIQQNLHALERIVAPSRPIALRMGIAAGEVVMLDGELFGPAVNIAARLLRLGGPGEICIAGSAFEDALPTRLRCTALGKRRLRHVAEPVSVFRIARTELGWAPYLTAPSARPLTRVRWRKAKTTATGRLASSVAPITCSHSTE